jgi:hypothetical protein
MAGALVASASAYQHQRNSGNGGQRKSGENSGISVMAAKNRRNEMASMKEKQAASKINGNESVKAYGS